MPWGLVNYEYKGPHWARPLHSTLALPPREESGFLERILQTLRLVWARSKPERFPITYYHFMNNNTQGRILYYPASVVQAGHHRAQQSL